MKQALLAALLIIASAADAARGDLRSVAEMQYHQRVLLVFAPTLRDPRLTDERRTMAAMALDAAARDLQLVQVSGEVVIGARDKAQRLRHRFKIAPRQFKALLIGKDGHVALASDQPLGARTLIGTIDAMPMRQDEMRRVHEGRPPPGL